MTLLASREFALLYGGGLVSGLEREKEEDEREGGVVRYLMVDMCLCCACALEDSGTGLLVGAEGAGRRGRLFHVLGVGGVSDLVTLPVTLPVVLPVFTELSCLVVGFPFTRGYGLRERTPGNI